MTPYTKLLVATDFSERADEALDTAIDLALRYRASLALVHVFDRYPLIEAGAIATSLQVAQAEDACQQALDKQRLLAMERGVQRVSATLLHGHPPTQIVDYAKATAVDLIVMGTHGRRGVSHFLLGSVAERVVRTATCAVLTVRMTPPATA